VRYALDRLRGDEQRLLLDHLHEGSMWHQGVGRFAIQSVGDLSQSTERDAVVSFRQLSLVHRGSRDAEAPGCCRSVTPPASRKSLDQSRVGLGREAE